MKKYQVPKQSKDGLNEVLAGFIHFLLQTYTPHEADPIKKELAFLLTFLGDSPFQLTELEDVNKILKEFEAVANEAGGIIYSRYNYYSRYGAAEFQARVSSLLEKIEVLNEKIKLHCINFESGIVKRHTSAPADLLFTVDTLIEDLENMESHHQVVELIGDVKDQTTQLHKQLISARSFLRNEGGNSEEYLMESSCVIGIRDVAYEAQYLINSFVVGNVPVWFLTLRLQQIIHKFEILCHTCFDEIKKKKKIVKELNIGEVSLLPTVSNSIQHIVDDDVVLGFENETEKILDELTGGTPYLQIISICGMPGIGKTTLAKALYAHPTTTYQFDQLARCVVSQTYDRRKALIEILMSLRSKLDKDKISQQEDHTLGLEIFQSLKGRRYLILIDDIWKTEVWDDLGRYFPDDGNRSRIMFTTRNGDMFPNGIVHMLPLLSEDQCWELLEKKVFCRKENCPPQLRNVGKRIAACCRGLPLAVVAIAGELANMEKKLSLWEKVEENIYSYVSGDPDTNYMKILEMSYKHLPPHLKLCFLYLGAFPEDSKIAVKKLKLLWLAEGFIQEEKEKSRDEVAEEYLKDLIGRSLLLIAERNSIGGIKTCTIHDLMRDMCIKQAEEENFMKIIKSHSSVYNSHRRLCIHNESLAESRPFGLHCRSFIGHLSDPSICFLQTKLVRILDVASATELTRIHTLVHLRYLVIDRMPKPIAELAKLVNLEVLLVYGGSKRVYIPSVILKMMKLKHLHFEKRASFEERKPDTSHSNNIESLSYINIFHHNAEKILRCSPHLRKLKCICDRSFFPDLTSFSELESLNMKFNYSVLDDVDVKMVNFPLTIKKLSLSGIELPWEEMSIIGRLPKLCVLKLIGKAVKGKIWETREDEFPELKFLELEETSVEEWISSSEHFPKLEHLVLRYCDKLQGIPGELGDIPTLQKIIVDGCSDGAWESAEQIAEEQQENGNEELKVIISNCWGYTRKKIQERLERYHLARSTEAAEATES